MKTMPYDGSKYLDTKDKQDFILSDAFETGDYKHIIRALNTVARAQNMTKLAQDIGISRTSLYKILEGEHVPNVETFFALISQFGGKISYSSAA